MIIFRADGNSSVGLGHVMRCLSIADSAKEMGEKCLFVTTGKELLSTITSHSHECMILNTDYTHMDAELEQFLPVIQKSRPSALFIDSYFVTDTYLRQVWNCVKQNSGKLVYIDDVLSFPYYCDILVNYNIFGPDKIYDYNLMYQEAKISPPKFLLGTSYAPLREEFQNLQNRKVKKKAKDILISTGGSDSEHLTAEIVKSLMQFQNQYTFHIIIGSLNMDKEIIQNIAHDNSRIVLYDNVKHMANLMSGCDVAISAAGSTLYELCATQTPTITYIIADNQIPGAEGFSNHQILDCAGDIRNLGAAKLSEYLIRRGIELAQNYDKRLEISTRMRSVVDGIGAQNLLNAVKDISG